MPARRRKNRLRCLVRRGFLAAHGDEPADDFRPGLGARAVAASAFAAASRIIRSLRARRSPRAERGAESDLVLWAFFQPIRQGCAGAAPVVEAPSEFEPFG